MSWFCFSLCEEIWSLRCICFREICFPFVHDQFHPSLCLILTVFGYVHQYFLPFNFVYKGFVANIFSSLKILFCRVSSWVFVPWKAFSFFSLGRNTQLPIFILFSAWFFHFSTYLFVSRLFWFLAQSQNLVLLLAKWLFS